MTDATTQLHRLRASIDNIDAALIFLLAERFRSTQQVGVLKAEHRMPASDPAREEQQIARLRALAHDADLDPEFAEKWFNFVVAEVIRHHTAAGAPQGDTDGDAATAD
ncbi:chorismate mutase [Microbacterium sp. CH-015]|uniref:chorismate mutase n=1 Tax=Microbacterium sp. CH-015 TaxID=3406734 RepID=UPI003C779231